MLGLQWSSCLEEGVGQSQHSSLKQRSELRAPQRSEGLEGGAKGGKSRARSNLGNEEEEEDVYKGKYKYKYTHTHKEVCICISYIHTYIHREGSGGKKRVRNTTTCTHPAT